MQKVLLYAGPIVAINGCDENVPGSKQSKYKTLVKTLLIMKLVLFFIVAMYLQAHAKGYGQGINLSFKNTRIEIIFNSIQQQSGYFFIYTKEELATTKPVSIEVKNATLNSVLDLCFKDQPVSFTLNDPYIIVKKKEKTASVQESIKQVWVLKGVVKNEEGNPIEGATIQIKGSAIATASNEKGEWELNVNKGEFVLVISSIGYKAKEIPVKDKANVEVVLARTINSLDATVIIAYGNTTKRLNTGNVGRISAEAIAQQPVSNVLAALHGKVPGVTVTQTSGLPGAAVRIQIRGRTSINSSINNDPLFIIDGVPFAANNDRISQSASALGNTGLSPFNAINAEDIESIEILKDADATAIYGSRGANGVVLITTKKGKTGETKLSFNFYSGLSRVTRSMDMLNTQQYLEMRREAFANDGLIPSAVAGTPSYAPDLMIWDTTRYTDLKKLLIGGTAHTSNAQINLSGGTALTQFLFGTGYKRETTIYPGSTSDSRVSFHATINHQSVNKKFNLSFKSSYVYNKNNVTISDLSTFLRLSPTIPSLYDSTGKLNWQQGGVSFDNPLANTLREFTGHTYNLLNNLQAGYKILPGLNFKTSIGYNSIDVNDRSITPIASQNPANNPLGNSTFGTTDLRSIIIEPQINYERNKGLLKTGVLVGGTYQQTENRGNLIRATGYSNDALLKSVAGAAATTISSSYSLYRYAAFFGRVNMSWDGRYMLNLTGRRDGSSRFGPGKQYSNFGSVGAAWIFSKEDFFKNVSSVVSYGKLRFSYGTTGNDKIGDYGYLNLYSATGLSYQGTQGLYPSTLFNPDFAWELNKKAEIAIDFGFLKDRLLLSVACYRNRCSNQLINYALPSQTGGTSIVANFPATVQNSGIEGELSYTSIKRKNFEWSSSFNITIPRNKLISFPGIESSSYSNLSIGESLSISGGYRLVGVNTQTGVYEYYNKDGQVTGTPVNADRLKNIADLQGGLYGGLNNLFVYKNWEAEFFFEFRKQAGYKAFYYLYSSPLYPGTLSNQPSIVLDRWRQVGDISDIQRFTTRSGTAAFTAANVIRINGVDGQFGDASYIRLKNLSISYKLNTEKWRRKDFEGLSFFFRAQNLLTITGYEGNDPETQDLFRLPPLKTVVVGFSLIL